MKKIAKQVLISETGFNMLETFVLQKRTQLNSKGHNARRVQAKIWPYDAKKYLRQVAGDITATIQPSSALVSNVKELAQPRSVDADELLKLVKAKQLLKFANQHPGATFEGFDECRTLACSLKQAYTYARCVDRGPTDETREAVLNTQPRLAYKYARDIDKCPRDDTRRVAIENGWAYYYARYVDKGPHDDTRKAACKIGIHMSYARYVDKCSHPVTRRKALVLGDGYLYARYIDKCRSPDTASNCQNHVLKYVRYFDQGRPTLETRRAVLLTKNVCTILRYAKEIEKQPVDEQRAAICKFGRLGYEYALSVDKRQPHELTRQNACKYRKAIDYAMFIDKGPHELTRLHCLPGQALEYALHVDKGPHPVTFLLFVNDNEIPLRARLSRVREYISYFGDPQLWMSSYLDQQV